MKLVLTLMGILSILILRSNVASGDCDFQQDFCAWVAESSNNHFQWRRIKSTTPSVNTGPINDRNGNKSAYYLYTESSKPSKLGDTATLTSPELPKTSGTCLTFYYNANGKNIGEMVVAMKVGGKVTSLEKSIGDKGKVWHKEVLTVKSNEKYQIVFISTRGNGFACDSGLDDVSFTEGSCPIPKKPKEKPTTVVTGNVVVPPKPDPLPVYGVTKIGCFKDRMRDRAFPEVKLFDRNTVDMYDISKVVKRCRDFVRAKGPEYNVFGVQFYSECYFGSDTDPRMMIDKHGEASDCVNFYSGGGFQNMVYRLNRDKF